MPPRLPEFPCLRALEAALPSSNGRRIASPFRSFTSSASHQGKKPSPGGRKYRDPYVLAQIRARKAANISKQESLKATRAASLGDPVRGIETSFVKSFDTAKDETAADAQSTQFYLNHFIKEDEVAEQLATSKELVTPLSKTIERHPAPSGSTEAAAAQHQEMLNDLNADTMKRFTDAHSTVEEAMKRITNLSNGSSKDRFRVNVQRCISTFGRHETDQVLPRKPKGIPISSVAEGTSQALQAAAEAEPLIPKDRKGPDTGSSEVQIAILTAKIRAIANHMERVGNKDKVNKRNLRLMVHRRQKLLQYLRRKERAGPRWQRCIEMLGLTEGTWRGEITL